MKLIKEAQGRVLNMSAGGSESWFHNVVELETAIFRNTDIVGDGHALPFGDGVFDAVLAINAFEHYRQPDKVVSEILRVLKPGGRVFIHTAFLQPLHEPPWHFFNCTKFGLQEWFSPFEIVSLQVSENFNPIYALAWQADEMLAALRAERGAAAGERIGENAIERPRRILEPACLEEGRYLEGVLPALANRPGAPRRRLRTDRSKIMIDLEPTEEAV